MLGYANQHLEIFTTQCIITPEHTDSETSLEIFVIRINTTEQQWQTQGNLLEILNTRELSQIKNLYL